MTRGNFERVGDFDRDLVQPKIAGPRHPPDPPILVDDHAVGASDQCETDGITIRIHHGGIVSVGSIGGRAGQRRRHKQRRRIPLSDKQQKRLATESAETVGDRHDHFMFADLIHTRGPLNESGQRINRHSRRPLFDREHQWIAVGIGRFDPIHIRLTNQCHERR